MCLRSWHKTGCRKHPLLRPLPCPGLAHREGARSKEAQLCQFPTLTLGTPDGASFPRHHPSSTAVTLPHENKHRCRLISGR